MQRALPIFALFLLLFFGCKHNPASEELIYEKEQILMGTVFKIKVAVDENEISKSGLDTLINEAFAKIDSLEQDMSEWIASSPISQVAANSGKQPVKITPDIAELISEALAISRQTNGAFDISFKPLGRLWDVKNRTEPPTDAEIDSAKQYVDFTQIQLDSAKLTLFLKKPGMQIGLGGIAKGYAAKAAGQVLASHGIRNYIVNAGGDLYFAGKKGEKHWTSGIKNPENPNEPFSKFEIIKDQGIATSGDYENFFVYNEKRYHHIINPKTGYPSEGYHSVTVFSENPALADAYATAFFLVGYENALKIVEEVPTIAFIMIDNDYDVIKSPNLDQFIREF